MDSVPGGTSSTASSEGGGREATARGPLGESWRAWIALGVGVLAVSAHSGLAYGTSPLMKPITDELGWTRGQYAAAMNLRLLLMMLLVPLAGQLVDRAGARVVMAAGALLMGVGALGFSRVGSLAELYATSLSIGPGQACIGSVAGSALVLRLFRRRRGLAIGILNGGDNLVTSAVHVGAATLLGRVGWRGALAAIGLGYVMLAALVVVALRAGEGQAADGRVRTRASAGAPLPSDAPASPSGALEASSNLPWHDRSLWLLLGAYMLIYAFITTVGIHFPAFQRDLGRSAEEASYIYGLTTLVGAAGSVAWGWLTERTSARAALSVVVALLASTSVVLWLPSSLGVFYLWAVVYGIANAGAVVLLALVLSELFGAARIGALMGLAMAACMAGTIVANFAAAAAFDRLGSYLPVWRAYTVIMVLTLVPLELLRRRKLAAGRHGEAASRRTAAGSHGG